MRFLCLLLFSTYALADNFLFFPIDRNNVQILPQRFEYQLINKDLFRVGDALMDATQISFQIQASNESRTQFRLRFRWPAALVRQGEVLIRDNAGKSLWSTNIENKSLKVTSSLRQIDGNDALRADLAQFEKSDIPLEVIQRLQILPFFKLCVLRTEELTKVHICSKDLYFKTNKGTFTIHSRDSFRQESFVDINGKAVNPQGMIFLQGLNDTISMRALLVSGATIEVDTRMKPVDWRDITESDEGKKLIIRAVGAEPADEKLILSKSTESWQMELDKDRPVIYLKGEGGIPLRQEFIVGGSVRSDRLMIPYVERPPSITYSRSLELELKPPTGILLSSNDKNSTVKKTDNNIYQWTIDNLETDRKNRRFIKVQIADNHFVGAIDVTRGVGKELNFALHILKSAQIQWRHWLGPSWGYEITSQHLLLKSASDPQYQAQGVRAIYRPETGLYLTDLGWFFGIGAEHTAIDSSSILSPTLSFYNISLAPEWTYFFNLASFEFHYGMGGSQNGLNYGQIYRIGYQLGAKVKKDQILYTGFRLDSFKFSDQITTWPTLQLSYSFLF